MQIHNCQHTEIGEKCCAECEYFGIIPKIRHIGVVSKTGKISNFDNMIFNISRLKFKEDKGKVVAAFIDTMRVR
jgi:hypothetical protein